MQNQNKLNLISLLILLIVITLAYAFGFFEIFIYTITTKGTGALIEISIKYLPFLVILICSIFPLASLLFKHKLHSQDGEILPLLFTIISLNAFFIIPDALDAMGYVFLLPKELIILERFALLSSFSIFLLSALRYYGFSSSNMIFYNLAFLSFSFLLSVFVPFSSYKGKMDLHSSLYEVYIQFIILALCLCTLITFILIAIKDKTSLNIKRSIGFITMLLGLYLSLFNTETASIISPLLFIPGTILLVQNVGDTL